MTTAITRAACPICHSANTSARAHHGRAFDDLACDDCGAWWRADHLTGQLVSYDADLDHDQDGDEEIPAPPARKRKAKPAPPPEEEPFDPDQWFGADGWSPWRDDSDQEAPRTPTCRPFVESTSWDFRRDAETPPQGHLRYRGACTGCDWHGPIHFLGDDGENGAAEDANDHAFPGWRQLPAIPEGVTSKWDQTYNDRQRAIERDKLVAKLIALGYPEEWTQRPGAPIRTLRANDLGMRHVPDRSPFGGYDLSVPSAEALETPGPLFATAAPPDARPLPRPSQAPSPLILNRIGMPTPKLTPTKREPETYCFRCGEPVPGGLFVTNGKARGRNVSWVNADGGKSHDCPLFAPPDVRRDIIERYSTSAEQQDEATEELTDGDLVGHLAGLFDQLEEQIETLPDGPQRVAAIECRDTALADLEAMTGNVKPAQELAL